MVQERLDSSGRGRNEYANANRPDDQDGPAASGSGTSAPGELDPGARLRRALSRNTLLPQDVPSTSKGTGNSGSKPSDASQGRAINFLCQMSACVFSGTLSESLGSFCPHLHACMHCCFSLHAHMCSLAGVQLLLTVCAVQMCSTAKTCIHLVQGQLQLMHPQAAAQQPPMSRSHRTTCALPHRAVPLRP